MILKDMIIKKMKRKEFVPKILSELQDILSMSVIPKRIEAFDNSNLQDADFSNTNIQGSVFYSSNLSHHLASVILILP